MLKISFFRHEPFRDQGAPRRLEEATWQPRGPPRLPLFAAPTSMLKSISAAHSSAISTSRASCSTLSSHPSLVEPGTSRAGTEGRRNRKCARIRAASIEPSCAKWVSGGHQSVGIPSGKSVRAKSIREARDRLLESIFKSPYGAQTYQAACGPTRMTRTLEKWASNSVGTLLMKLK